MSFCSKEADRSHGDPSPLDGSASGGLDYRFVDTARSRVNPSVLLRPQGHMYSTTGRLLFVGAEDTVAPSENGTAA